MKIFHRNFILTLYQLYFFWQFWQRYSTRWVIVIYISPERHLKGICSPFMRKITVIEPPERIHDNRTFFGPTLPWALIMKSVELQTIQNTAPSLTLFKTSPNTFFPRSLPSVDYLKHFILTQIVYLSPTCVFPQPFTQHLCWRLPSL